MNNIGGIEKHNSKKYDKPYSFSGIKILKMLGLKPKDIKKQRK